MPPAAPAGTGWPRQGEHAARCRQREEYAARRALFLQTYRLSAPGEDDDDEPATGLRGRAARLLREARVAGRAAAARAACRLWVAGRASAAGAASRARSWLGAGLGRAWRGWTRRPLPRAHGHGHGHGQLHHRSSLLGCFGGRYRYLQGFA